MTTHSDLLDLADEYAQAYHDEELRCAALAQGVKLAPVDVAGVRAKLEAALREASTVESATVDEIMSRVAAVSALRPTDGDGRWALEEQIRKLVESLAAQLAQAARGRGEEGLAMGLFDYVTGFSESCAKCGAAIPEWQTKDGDPYMNRRPVEEVMNWYAMCRSCKAWNEYVRDPATTYRRLADPEHGIVEAQFGSARAREADAAAGQTAAARDVLAERERQKAIEGWTPEHDDEHANDQMALAAVCYADPCPQLMWRQFQLSRNPLQSFKVPKLWPWDPEWWKPKDRRRNLVRAAALLLAEIERLDRSAVARPSGGGA